MQNRHQGIQAKSGKTSRQNLHQATQAKSASSNPGKICIQISRQNLHQAIRAKSASRNPGTVCSKQSRQNARQASNRGKSADKRSGESNGEAGADQQASRRAGGSRRPGGGGGEDFSLFCDRPVKYKDQRGLASLRPPFVTRMSSVCRNGTLHCLCERMSTLRQLWKMSLGNTKFNISKTYSHDLASINFIISKTLGHNYTKYGQD